MDNRNLFRNGLMLAAGLLPSVAGHSADRQSSPNFVFFMAEDLTSQSFAMFNGGNGALTPNLERMAEHGVTFVNAYSNAPRQLCRTVYSHYGHVCPFVGIVLAPETCAGGLAGRHKAFPMVSEGSRLLYMQCLQD